MTQIRFLIAAFLCLGLAILAGCSSTSKTGGGYYKDDGPGADIPANLDTIPDAVPRVEPHAAANFRPYVVFGKQYVPVSDERPFRQEGTASWYGRKFHGKKTANGETYDMYAMSAAHPTLPIPSYARVTHASTRKSVVVRINDRGPFHSSRIIDLSYVAAAKLGLIGPGSGQVIVEAITNADIRNNLVDTPKAAPLAPAPVPAAPPVQAVQAAPATPVAVNVAQMDNSSAVASASQIGTAPSQIYLQFGAFSVMQTADGLAQKLNQQIGGVESRQARVNSANKLYRVQIGPYPSRTDAVNAAQRLEAATGLQPAVAFH